MNPFSKAEPAIETGTPIAAPTPAITSISVDIKRTMLLFVAPRLTRNPTSGVL